MEVDEEGYEERPEKKEAEKVEDRDKEEEEEFFCFFNHSFIEPFFCHFG